MSFNPLAIPKAIVRPYVESVTDRALGSEFKGNSAQLKEMLDRLEQRRIRVERRAAVAATAGNPGKREEATVYLRRRDRATLGIALVGAALVAKLLSDQKLLFNAVTGELLHIPSSFVWGVGCGIVSQFLELTMRGLRVPHLPVRLRDEPNMLAVNTINPFFTTPLFLVREALLVFRGHYTIENDLGGTIIDAPPQAAASAP